MSNNDIVKAIKKNAEIEKNLAKLSAEKSEIQIKLNAIEKENQEIKSQKKTVENELASLKKDKGIFNDYPLIFPISDYFWIDPLTFASKSSA